jgi:Fe-S oxidoreductase
MSMDKEMQDSFAMFYGMSQSLEGQVEPIEMEDSLRVKKAKEVFINKANRDTALNLDACVKCGWCAEACQFYVASDDPKYTPIAKLDLMKKVHKRELGPFRWLYQMFTKDITADDLREYQPKVFDECTMCGRCSMICPMGIDIAEMVHTNREAMVEAGLMPSSLDYMCREQDKEGTIFGADEELLNYRLAELKKKFDVDIYVDKPDTEVLMLTSGLDIHLFTDAMLGTIKTLDHLGVNWSICSHAFEGANFGLLAGSDKTQKHMTMNIINAAVEMGVKMVLTPECGHTYPAMRWSGAEIYGKPLPFEVMTVSEYFGRQIMDGKLKLQKVPGNKVVTLHDPCKVGRHGGVFEEARAVIKELGLELHETESNRELNYCCGGGAGNFLIHSAAPVRKLGFQTKMIEVKDTGAESLVVSCGSCRLNFEAGKLDSGETIQIDSLAALVGENLLEQPAGEKSPQQQSQTTSSTEQTTEQSQTQDTVNAEQFSPEWMAAFKDAWNKNPKMTEPLAAINFDSNIGYGLLGEAQPRGVLQVENGRAVFGGVFGNQKLNWDIRANQALWDKWKKTPPNMTKIGLAYTTRRLQFNQGDYAAMLKEPKMAGPFIKSFETMSEIN